MVMTREKHEVNQMLSANQAGRLLGVSGKTMIRMMESGEIPGYRIGIAYKFRRGDIEQYLEAHKYQPDQPTEE